jgi:hypothetical protein
MANSRQSYSPTPQLSHIITDHIYWFIVYLSEKLRGDSMAKISWDHPVQFSPVQVAPGRRPAAEWSSAMWGRPSFSELCAMKNLLSSVEDLCRAHLRSWRIFWTLYQSWSVWVCNCVYTVHYCTWCKVFNFFTFLGISIAENCFSLQPSYPNLFGSNLKTVLSALKW